MARASLTVDALRTIDNGNLELKPVLQVLEVCQILTKQAVQERFRLVVSDGRHVQQAILASQLNHLVKTGEIKKGTLIQLQEYICNTVQNRKIIMVLNLEIVAVEAEMIGDPDRLIPIGHSIGPVGGSDRSEQQEQQKYQPQDSGTSQVEGSSNRNPAGNDPRPGGLSRSMQNHTTQGSFPPPSYSSKGPIAKNEAPVRILPIAALNPYQGRWTIKARVTAKGELRRFHNARGDGKVFHFDLLDADGGEIRATCFNAVADRFFDLIEVGKVYFISKGSLKASQKSFNHLKNEWEIFLDNSSKVESCFEEDASIPQQQFDFRPISEVENLETTSMVDVIGIVVSVGPTNTIMRKNGVETQKRTLQLRDKSNKSVELTMWGAFCGKEGQELHYLCECGKTPVLAVKAGRVADFSGKSVGTISTTQLMINPEIALAHDLRRWFEREGNAMTSESISKEGSGTQLETRKCVAQIRDEGLGMSDKPDWIAVKATIAFIKTDNFCYTACPMSLGDRQCNKKVTNNDDGTWRCDRCDRSFPECDYRYLLTIQVQDHSGVTWITAFQEAGQEILGVPAKDLYTWKQNDDPQFEDSIKRLLFTEHLFKLKVKEENFNDERRVKCTLIKSEKLNYSVESKVLLGLIGKLSFADCMLDAALAKRTLGASDMPDAGVSGNVFSRHDLKYPSLAASGMIEPAHGYSGKFLSIDGFGVGNVNASNSCFKCGQMGHWSMHCPNQSSQGYGRGRGYRGGSKRAKSGGYSGGY